MTAEARVQTARRLLATLVDAVAREGYDGRVWAQRLRDLDAALADPEPPATVRLAEANRLLDALYDGPRNFADFHVYRDDPDQRIAENQRLSGLVDELTATLRGTDR